MTFRIKHVRACPGEIWWVDFRPKDKVRPAMVLRCSSQHFLVAPMSCTESHHSGPSHRISSSGTGLGQTSWLQIGWTAIVGAKMMRARAGWVPGSSEYFAMIEPPVRILANISKDIESALLAHSTGKPKTSKPTMSTPHISDTKKKNVNMDEILSVKGYTELSGEHRKVVYLLLDKGILTEGPRLPRSDFGIVGGRDCRTVMIDEKMEARLDLLAKKPIKKKVIRPENQEVEDAKSKQQVLEDPVKEMPSNSADKLAMFQKAAELEFNYHKLKRKHKEIMDQIALVPLSRDAGEDLMIAVSEAKAALDLKEKELADMSEAIGATRARLKEMHSQKCALEQEVDDLSLDLDSKTIDAHQGNMRRGLDHEAKRAEKIKALEKEAEAIIDQANAMKAASGDLRAKALSTD